MQTIITVLAGAFLLAFLFGTKIFSRDRSKICLSCGRSRPQVAKIITGPDIGICADCVGKAVAAMEGTGPVWRFEDPASQSAASPGRCSFCHKRIEDVRGLVAISNGAICNECLGLCVEILDEGAAA
jgi:hypothetical protein